MLDNAVIFTYSFDDECSVFLFVSEREAVDFLRKSFAEECRIDKKKMAGIANVKFQRTDGRRK